MLERYLTERGYPPIQESDGDFAGTRCAFVDVLARRGWVSVFVGEDLDAPARVEVALELAAAGGLSEGATEDWGWDDQAELFQRLRALAPDVEFLELEVNDELGAFAAIPAKIANDLVSRGLIRIEPDDGDRMLRYELADARGLDRADAERIERGNGTLLERLFAWIGGLLRRG